MASTENSFMKSLFFGQIREDLIFPYPRIAPEVSENVKMMIESIERFGKDQVKSREWDEKGEMPREIVSYMAELGLLGVAVPEDHGGLGMPQMGYARIFENV